MADLFRDAMRLMRRHDRQAQEDGFNTLQPVAAEYTDQLIAEFRQENDHGLRCWLLDLIGEARSETAFPLLVEYLHGNDQALRIQAVAGLEKLDTKQAREELWRSRSSMDIRRPPGGQ
jgi:hypothetical protein